MKFNPFRRIRDKWKQRRSKSRLQPEQLLHSRRLFLRNSVKWTAALLAGTGASCVTPLEMLSKFERAQLEDSKLLAEKKPIVTALREGKSVKIAFENWPNTKTYEMAFYKEKSGEIISAATERFLDKVRGLLPLNARSIVHNHPYSKMGSSRVNLLITSNPSVRDALSSMGLEEPGIITTPARFNHVAAMNKDGKIMGYFSLGQGKKLREIINQGSLSPKNSEFYDRIARLRELDVKIFEEYYSDKKTENNVREFLKILNSMRELGLQIRATPMPGYTFKDGYFQIRTTPAKIISQAAWEENVQQEIKKKGGHAAAERRAYQQWLRK